MFSYQALFLVLVFLFNPSQGGIKSEITFCNLEVSKNTKRANASFSVIYAFEIDQEGKPSKIQKIQDKYVGKEKVIACLSEWRFIGLPSGTDLIAFFRWQHGKGWVEVSVVGQDFKQVIKIKDGIGY